MLSSSNPESLFSEAMWQHLALVQQLDALRLRLEEVAGRMTQAAAQEQQNPVVRERRQRHRRTTSVDGAGKPLSCATGRRWHRSHLQKKRRR